MSAFNPIAGETQESKSADVAWVEYSALMRAVRDAPSLRDDPRWEAMKSEAYERFVVVFGSAA